MPKSKWRWYGGIFIVVCVSLWPISYLIIINSTPYEIARNIIKQSPVVQKELGEVANIRLSPVGYAAGFGSSDGYADLELSVKGQRAAGKVEIDLDQKGDSWRVLRAVLITSDGRKVDITDEQKR